MTETRFCSFDPGYVTGVTTAVQVGDKPLEILTVGVLTYEQVLDLARTSHFDTDDVVIVERFDLRTNNDFAADLTGVRVEGILELRSPNLVWRSRTDKAQVSDNVLKEHGLWVTGKDVDWTDGRDANDATKHLLGHVAFTMKHKPTLRKYFKPSKGTEPNE